jgi:hypothetical protein
MGYTKRKIRSINFSFFLAGFIFAGWALFCAWYGWPRNIRGGSAVGFSLFAVAALFFSAFPVIWARYPEKHPVNHELARYGKLAKVADRLDKEMAGQVDILGPFRFTATMLVNDAGHEFQMIPYAQITAAEIATPDPPALIVRTRKGRHYQWYSTWMQGIFNPEEVLTKIRTAANLADPGSSVSSASSVV